MAQGVANLLAPIDLCFGFVGMLLGGGIGGTLGGIAGVVSGLIRRPDESAADPPGTT